MSIQFWATSAVYRRQQTGLFLAGFRVVLFVGALGAVAGCTRSQPFVGPDPSDPHTPVRVVAYRSTIAPYRMQRPVEPGDWREINERITPQPQPGRQ